MGSYISYSALASNGSSECFYSRPSAVLIEDTGLGSAV